MTRRRLRRSPPVGGLPFPIDPNISAAKQKALWQAELHPFTLNVRAVDLSHLPVIHRRAAEGGDHILIADKQGDHRLIWSENRLDSTSQIIMPFNRMLPYQAIAATRFWRCHAGKKPGPFPRLYRLTRQQRTRLGSALQQSDARKSGASRRRIAEVMQSSKLSRSVWSDSSERAQSRRLQKLFTSLIDGGYRTLLNPFQT